MRWATAAAVGAAAAIGALSCMGAPTELLEYAEAPPSAEERYCAWYGDARADILYFGEAPFWWAYRRGGGDPKADLALAGPQLVGRFDVRRRRFLPPLDLGTGGSAAGTWDVLAHPNGRVYFTDFFGASGYVEPASGVVVRFDALGAGLNELALGPDDHLLATRYGDARGADGSVVALDIDGALLAEHPLHGPPGFRVAPKSVAWDPVRREIWVNTDLIPIAAGDTSMQHDARVLGADGAELLRFATPELQFMTFSEDGTGWFAEVDGRFLRLRIRAPERAGSALLTGRSVPLDDEFTPGADFVQDLHVADGSVVVTRWSGRIHVVDRSGARSDVVLPAGDGDLYYSAVLSGGAVCATQCGGVEVVCRGVGD